MDNEIPNGEPKNMFLKKPALSQITESEPSTSSSPPPYRPVRATVGTRVRYPQKRYVPQVDRNPEEHLTNQKKQRYWNSWEELYIVELWRRYRDEVTILNVPLPVYRKMMITMRNRNMMVTAQDCRRKVNTLNTRYRQELKRMESSGCKSDWRLFPLIHCIMSPKVKIFDACHELKIIKKLLDKLPKPVEIKPPPPSPAPITAAINQNQQQSLNLHSSSQINNARAPPQQTMPPPPPPTVFADSSPTKLPNSPARFEKPSILPFRNITLEKIEQLRQENNRLALERDEALQRFQFEQKAFKSFEIYIRTWKAKMKSELRKVKKISEDCVIKTENEDNHNAEQKLQETVAVN